MHTGAAWPGRSRVSIGDLRRCDRCPGLLRDVGQVEPVLCNIRDDASVTTVTNGAHAVVNCVGILSETGKNTFQDVQASGAARVARISSEQGVVNFVQISAIGANEAALSDYAKTKAFGEAAVLSYFPDATILRPSIIFGPEQNPLKELFQLQVQHPPHILVEI